MKNLLKSISLLCFVVLSGCTTISRQQNASELPPLNIQTLWINSTAQGTQSYYLRLNPIIKNDQLFLTDYSGHILAINAQTGTTLWGIDTQSHLTTGVAVDQDRLFVSTEEGQLIAFDSKDGTEQWRTSTNTQALTSPLAMKGQVFVKGIDNSITAFSQRNGKQLWYFKELPSSLILHASSRLQTAGNKLIAGFSNGKLAVINPKNGAIYWSQTIAEPRGTNAIEQMVDIDATPLVVNGIIYAVTYQGQLAALDLSSGHLLWKHRLSSYSGMAADLKNIYLSDEKGDLWAFNENTGAIIWHQTELSGLALTGPTLYRNKLLVVGDQLGNLYWLSANNGKLLATIQLDESGLITQPVVKNNILYAQTQGGSLYAFKLL